MRDELLGYYERELTFLRQMGAEFADKYPKIASRLELEPDKCEDPHVERMIEAFAFLAGRVHLKIDDEFPELTESLLNILYPNFLAPVPSLSLVQFVLDPERANLQTGQTIPRGSLLSSQPVEGTPCRFRTSYPVTIWPVEVSAARFELPEPGTINPEGTRTILRLTLKTLGGVPFAELKEKKLDEEGRPLERLRFYLQGDAKVVHGLYELLFTGLLETAAVSSKGAAPSLLPQGCVRPVGFEREEGLLPGSDRSFLGYRLLQEYFAFPEKFLFFDLCRLDTVAGTSPADTLEILFYFGREFSLEKSVTGQTFRLHCAPIANLFNQIAEPIRVTHLQPEYRVIPDTGRQSALEVYSVDSVVAARPGEGETVEFQPFYSFKHAADRGDEQTFWYASRRASQRRDDEGTEVYLSLVDLGFNPMLPAADTLTVHATCTNRDLPGRLPFGGSDSDFQLEAAGVFQGIRCLRKPTPTLRVPLRRGVQWRLISHLSLNFLSLVEGGNGAGPEAFREILKLYDFADSSVTRQQIAGISRLSAQRVLRPVGGGQGGFVRGLEVSLELDEPQFIGSGVFLFAAVLERFLGLYASINSFSQLTARTRQREGVLKRWPPRAGEQILL